MSLYELFQELREEGIEQLGEVRRAYLEKDGQVTVFRQKGEAPEGLAIVPPSQIEPRKLVTPGDPAAGDVALVCATCGNHYAGSDHCANCDRTEWTPAAR